MTKSGSVKSLPIADPSGYSSGYLLSLYCDHDGGGLHRFSEFPHSYTGETFGECARQARQDGWIIRTETETATCPKCSHKRSKSSP
ncbi:hypothetical protein ACVIGB_000541 [Bradyrhizobium sp. USDA 4341]